MKLDCRIQRYAWGKQGKKSLVAKLKESTQSICENDPYAELWMGTHPSGPSSILQAKVPLGDVLKENPHFVGFVPQGYPSDDLPFLFKVLSINTALSIQAHPDKQLAKKLHLNHPDVYKDDNHKPEMTIALTPFDALCGFLTLTTIQQNMIDYPELEQIINHDGNFVIQQEDIASLRHLFASFMRCPTSIASTHIRKLQERVVAKSSCGPLSDLETLLLKLQQEYPDDRGVLTPLLLNYLRLQPGECFFIGPNEPHAYLSGDCIECMALSDNVVRAGLTPKFCDVETLCSMLHYRSGAPPFLLSTVVDSCTSLFRPPVDICAEFEVFHTALPPLTTYDLPIKPCGSILIVTKQEGSPQYSLKPHSSSMEENSVPTTAFLMYGDVVFVPAHYQFSLVTSSDDVIELYGAHVNLESTSQ